MVAVVSAAAASSKKWGDCSLSPSVACIRMSSVGLVSSIPNEVGAEVESV